MELTRTAIGLIAAVSVPSGLGWYKRLPLGAVLFALIYGAIVVLPTSRSVGAWLTLLGVALLATCIAVFSKSRVSPATEGEVNPQPKAKEKKSDLLRRSMTAARYSALAGVVAAVLILAFVGWEAGARYLGDVVTNSDRLMITLSGLLVAVFGCQFIIGVVVRPLLNEIEAKIEADELPENTRDFIKVGPHVGWIERFILFVFLVSGSPPAAALVVTAKTLARAPEAKEGGKLVGDYYLIGTLISVAAALVAACLTRLALGLSPL